MATGENRVGSKQNRERERAREKMIIRVRESWTEIEMAWVGNGR